MTNIFFTSDLHFGHPRIIELVPRPFKDVNHMNRALIDNYNSVVGEYDICYFAGDICMGGWRNTLPLIGELNGVKHLVGGNHDKFFADKNAERQERIMDEYLEYFDSVTDGEIPMFGKAFAGLPAVTISHFPAVGDSQRESRYDEHRPRDDGGIVIHGHTHSTGDPLSITDAGTIQYHVGVDAHDYRPVSIDKVREAYDSISN